MIQVLIGYEPNDPRRKGRKGGGFEYLVELQERSRMRNP